MYHDVHVDMEICLEKRMDKSILVTIVWEGSMEKRYRQIDITGNDLNTLRQMWESSNIQDCWLNDNVWRICVQYIIY